MSQAMANDLDYLTAQIHGRRSRVADAERLDALCRLGQLPALGRAIYPDTEFQATADFQRRLAQELVREFSGFLKHLAGAGADLLRWMLARFQIENIKVLVRGFLHRAPLERPEEYLLALPQDLTLDAPAILAADSLEKLAELLPSGAPRKSLRRALGVYHEQPRPFFLEAALDQGYFQELLDRVAPLSGEDKELIKPIVRQEVDAFLLLLAVRGKFHYGLTPELLSPLHVRWSGIPSDRFNAMLTAGRFGNPAPASNTRTFRGCRRINPLS